MNSLTPARSRLPGHFSQEVTLLSVIEATAGRLALLCGVGVGHITERIGELGAMLGLETIRVC